MIFLSVYFIVMGSLVYNNHPQRMCHFLLLCFSSSVWNIYIYSAFFCINICKHLFPPFPSLLLQPPHPELRPAAGLPLWLRPCRGARRPSNLCPLPAAPYRDSILTDPNLTTPRSLPPLMQMGAATQSCTLVLRAMWRGCRQKRGQWGSTHWGPTMGMCTFRLWWRRSPVSNPAGTSHHWWEKRISL